jgi:CheY-like chemotaxis protein
MGEARSRILCVEDNRDSREMISTLLREADANYDVTAVETAAEALAMNGSGEFDLYILDIWLPGMDGVELCRRLREKGIKKPIMFFSAMGVQTKDRDYLLAAGANEFLVKSLDLDKFTDTVDRLLTEDLGERN